MPPKRTPFLRGCRSSFGVEWFAVCFFRRAGSICWHRLNRDNCTSSISPFTFIWTTSPESDLGALARVPNPVWIRCELQCSSDLSYAGE